MILAVFAIGIPLAYSVQRFPVPGFCKYICPAGTFEGAMGLLANPVNAEKFSILNILFTRKFIIMVLIFTVCIFCYRAFCRFLCPLGAIYGMFARLAVVGVKVEPGKCTNCGRCVSHCQMDISRVGDHECISCGSCIDVCPTKAISMKAGKIVLIANETGKPGETSKKMQKRRTRSLIAWVVALAVLVGVVYFVNRDTENAQATPDVAEVTEETNDVVEDDTPIGKEVGMRCPDFTVPLYGEGGNYTLSEHGGKVRVLNFWATWCTPCVGELPYFAQLYQEYGDTIDVLTMHSDMVTDDVQAFIDAEGLNLLFALDETGDVIKSLGGSTQLPMTVVVDQSGKIVYNQVGSVTYEKLKSLIEPLL